MTNILDFENFNDSIFVAIMQVIEYGPQGLMTHINEGYYLPVLLHNLCLVLTAPVQCSTAPALSCGVNMYVSKLLVVRP